MIALCTLSTGAADSVAVSIAVLLEGASALLLYGVTTLVEACEAAGGA